MVTNYLVVGSGSIAIRHIINLKALFSDAQVSCVASSGRELSSQDVPPGVKTYPNLTSALQEKPRFVIVASPAPFHAIHAKEVLSLGLPVLIEKPVAADLQSARELLPWRTEKMSIDIAYNLRFMPAAKKFKKYIDNNVVGRIHSVHAEVGQYLPDWRPQTDYRKNVSAQKKLGGGALLELSHELDYLGWIFGDFEMAYCVARNTGILDIDVEDCVDAILSKPELTATVHLDFLQRSPKRYCKVIAENGTLVWDLIKNTIELTEEKNKTTVLFEDSNYDRNEMYLEQLRYFSQVIEGKKPVHVGLESGLKTLALVEALKASSTTGQAVKVGDFYL